MWNAFDSTISEEVKINHQIIKAIVLHNPIETDLETGTSYKSNKTVIVLEPKFEGRFKPEMPVSIGPKHYQIKEITTYPDELRIEINAPNKKKHQKNSHKLFEDEI